jgi:hypothetical protein
VTRTNSRGARHEVADLLGLGAVDQVTEDPPANAEALAVVMPSSQTSLTKLSTFDDVRPDRSWLRPNCTSDQDFRPSPQRRREV